MKSKHFIVKNDTPYPQKVTLDLLDTEWGENITEPRIVPVGDSPVLVEEFRMSDLVKGISSGDSNEPEIAWPKIRISSASLFSFEKSFIEIEKIFKEKLLDKESATILKTISKLLMEKTSQKQYFTFPDSLFFEDDKKTYFVSPQILLSAYQTQSHVVDGALTFDIEKCTKLTIVSIPPNSQHNVIIYINQK